MLGLDISTGSTRTWFYLLPAAGEPVKIVHSIEQDVLHPLPGTTTTYTEKSELVLTLSRYAGKRFAVLDDPDLTVISTMSGGHLSMIQSCGITTVTASRILQRLHTFTSQKDVESHEQAAAILYNAVDTTWKRLCSNLHSGKSVTEAAIRDFLLDCMTGKGLITNHPPIVAAGVNTANPHYSIPPGNNNGSYITENTLVQFDLWGKFPDGMYADISWVGFTGTVCPREYTERFELVRNARDLVVPAIRKAFSQKREITGNELDILVRSYLSSSTNPEWIRHRTGHAIDRECHGSGVNLDSVEFPDFRPVMEGSCFSVEPGIYCNRFGMRTEINVYIQNGIPVVSGLPIQNAMLLVQD